MKCFLRTDAICIFLVLVIGLTACAQSPEELMASAQEAVADGDYRTASIHLRNLLQSEPDNVDARLALGEVALITGDIASAEKELKRARDLGAGTEQVSELLIQALFELNRFQEVVDEIAATGMAETEMPASMLLLRGHSYQRLGKPDAAEQSFSTLIAARPDQPEGYAALAELMIATGRLDRADQLIDEALARDADYVPARLLKGRRLLATDGPVAALNAFSQSIAIASEQRDASALFQALTLAGDIQLSLRKLDEAGATIARLEAVAPSSLLTRYLRARLHAQSEENAEAISVLQGIVRDYPDFRPAKVLLGTVHFVEGNLQQAESQLNAVIQTDPGNIVVSRMLAEVRLRQGRAEQVADSLKADQDKDGNRVNQELLILAGQDSLKQGDIESALGYFRQGQEAFPDDTRFLLGEVTSYMTQGEPEKAKALLESLQTGDKSSDAVVLLSVMVHLQEEEFDAAIARAKELVANQPASMWAQQFLGAVYFAAGKNDLARAQLEIVLGSDPDNVAAMIGMARIAGRVGEPDRAREWLEKVRQANGNNITARVMLAQSYLAENEGLKALEVAREAAERAPDQIQPASLRAMAAASVGDWEEAIASFRHVVELGPDNALSLLNLAQAYFRSGDEKSGQAAVDKAVAVAPNDPRVLMVVGDREMALGEFRRAAETYRRVYELQPNRDAAGRIYRARVAAREPRPLEYIDLWLDEHPDDAAGRYFRAAVFQEQGNRKESIAEYERVLEQVPDQVLALNNLAWLYYEVGDARAVSVAERATALRPDLAAVTDTAGWIYLQTGDLSRGLELLAKAAEQSKGDSEILYHLAVAQDQDGQKDAAVATLEKALASDEVFTSRAEAQALFDKLNP